MKVLPLLLLLFLFADVHGQQGSGKNDRLSVFVGAKTRITPIYLTHGFEGYEIGYPDILEQPDYHLSGPGLLFSERIGLNRKLGLTLHQRIRYDMLYQRASMDLAVPTDFNFSIKRKWILDLGADLNYYFHRRKSLILLSFGAGLNGVNTGYLETRRFYQSYTIYYEKQTHKDFIFPSLSTGISWQKKKILAELKFGYCWDNPTRFASPFLYPELSVGYQFIKGK